MGKPLWVIVEDAGRSESHDAAMSNPAGVPTGSMNPEIVYGDLLDQDVEVVVNAWNRNVIPWWLLLPQGVSAAIKRRAGLAPFREVGRHGPIPLGDAVLTGAGRLPYKGIIHVAGINMLWRATPESIKASVRSAMRIVTDRRFKSVAFPIIGAGSGSFDAEAALDLMLDAFAGIDGDARAIVVKFMRGRGGHATAEAANTG